MIEVQTRQRKVRFDLALFRQRAGLVSRFTNVDDKEVACTLVSDPAIHELNRDYRGKDKPTDVLSFAQNEGEFADLNPDVLGDVIISVETAERQREERTLLDEVTHLLIHGVLHLQGYDHEKDDEAEEMEAEERRVWAAVHSTETGG